MAETWEDRYKRAVANFAGVPSDVPLESIRIEVTSEDGYRYSDYTFADPSINIWVRWGDPVRSAEIDGPEAVGNLIRSFMSPPTTTEGNQND